MRCHPAPDSARRGRAWLCALVLTAPLYAADFQPVTDAERSLTEVPGHPGAPAVVLFHRGHLDVMDYPKEVSSIFAIEARIKILTEEGLDYAEVEIPHSRTLRLTSFKGRTILPDGREVPLPDDAVFEEASSRSRKSYLTKAAFPAATVGAILDYRYTLRWDSVLFNEPWFFSSELPTLHSEIAYEIPPDMAAIPSARQVGGERIQSDLKPSPRGQILRAWMEDVRAVPDEPASIPFNDMANHVMLVPKSIYLNGQRVDLLANWRTVCELFEGIYEPFTGKSRKAKAQAKTLASGQPSPRAQIDAIFAFVRDEIRLRSSLGIYIYNKQTADKVLQEGQGADSDKALLLFTMLEALKLKPAPQLVWATHRDEGTPDLEVPNPWWFDRLLVAVELDGERLFLDPTDRGLAPGHLPPSVEGMPAVLVHPKKPEVITLPRTDWQENTRHARVRLTLDGEGRIAGDGSLVLGGHHAWRWLGVADTPEDATESWTEWLERRYEGYEVSEVRVEEKVDLRELRVDFQLVQREEDVLGDEASLVLPRPLGPVKQPFVLPPHRRLTAVQLDFPDRDEVTVELAWPEGWIPEILPREASAETTVGSFTTRLETDLEARNLTFSRRFDTRESDLRGRDLYGQLRNLYATAEKSDAQQLVLVLE